MSLRYLSSNRLSTRRLNLSNSVAVIDTVGDVNFGQTSLLLHGDGTNGGQNNTFLDGSPNALTFTRNGNSTQGSFSPYSQPNGYWSNYFDGSSRLNIAQTTPFSFGSGAFTVECWILRAATSSGSVYVCPIGGHSGGSTTWGMYVNTNNNYPSFYYNGSLYEATVAVPNNVWTHLAAVRDGLGNFVLYVNGISAVTASNSGSAEVGAGGLYIGRDAAVNSYFTGHISNVRIVKGQAVYSSNFTPSITPFTTTSQGATAANVTLIACQSNRFMDTSTNAYAVTVANGTPAVQPFSPLSSPTAYSPSSGGGSVYHDGSGDYIVSGVNSNLALGTSDFTIEYWVYPLALDGYVAPIVPDDVTTNYTPLFGYITPSNIHLYLSSAGSSWDISNGRAMLASPNVKQWYHVAVTRSGSTFRVFINGTQTDTFTSSLSIYQGAYKFGSGRSQSTQYFNGYVSDARLVIGTAVYTSAFTPPTAPLTAITNTKALLSFQNASIFDNAGGNDFETAGNAQISTGQSKFGGASMYFDGSTSYLNLINNPLNVMGDFTVEGWFFSGVATSTFQCLFHFGANSNANSLGSLALFHGNQSNAGASSVRTLLSTDGSTWAIDALSSTGVISNNTWYHFAIVRCAGTITTYINGNAVTSSTSIASTTSLYSGTANRIGAMFHSSPFYYTGYLEDLRVTRGVARYLYNFTPPTSAYQNNGYRTLPSITNDSYFGQASLLLHGDGSSGAQNNTFLDASPNAFTITRNGNATQGTFSPFSRSEGYWSNYFAGSQAVGAPASTDWQFSGDFTIEGWIHPTTTGDQTLFVVSNGSSYFAVTVNVNTGPTVYLNASTPTTSPTDVIPRANQWNHVALVRSGSTVKVYLNGVASSTTSTNSSTLGYNAVFYVASIGTQSSGSLTGYVSNLRVVNGTAVYTSNFTPSTVPLTAIANTKLLTCQSNRYKDNSTNAYLMSTYGSPSVQLLSPFEPTTAYSVATNGGSSFFDGSGDYLSVPTSSSFSFTGDFTIEMWYYMTASASASSEQTVFIQINGGSYFAINVDIDTGYSIYLNSGSASFQPNSILPRQNSWNHIALVRSGSTVTLYQNGVALTPTTTNSSTLGWSTVNVEIPTSSTAYGIQNGYISDVRVTNGTAVYTGAFTPPTAPLTAISNTKLLLSATNASIIDSTASNGVETVGTAQILSNQYKFGSGSMYFNGSTGTYLRVPYNDRFLIGSSDYTVEAWIYVTGYGEIVGAFSPNSPYPGWLFNVGNFNTADGKLRVYIANGSTSQTVAGASVVSTSTWHHVAFTKQGSTLRIFLNGNIDVTATLSLTSTGSNSPIHIGADTNSGPQRPLTGYIDDLRITKGVARYVSNFTIPTSAYPDK